MLPKGIYPDVSITVKAKQRRDGLWVADVRIQPEPSPEACRALISGIAFRSRIEAEAYVMKLGDALIHSARSKA
jgi:hypothetical protein